MTWTDFVANAGSFLKGAGWVALPLLALPVLRLLVTSKIVAQISDHLIGVIDGVNNWIGEVSKWALPLLVLSVAFGVFADSIFGLSWTKLEESAQYLHVLVIMMGSAAALLTSQHVRVDVFHTRMSPPQKARVDLWGFYILLMPVCLLILWLSQSRLNTSWNILEGSPEADGLHGVYLLKTSISVFCVMMLAQALAIALRAAAVLKGEPEPERPSHIPPLFPNKET